MDILLDRRLAFTVDNVRDNVMLPFTTGKDYDRIVICFHYSPKSISDPAIIRPQIEECVRKYYPPGATLTEQDMTEYQQLFNFVTLSADYNGSYVGCAHRHAPEQRITIAAHGSTWGFAPQQAAKGDWRVVLHVQAVVVGQVDFHITVCGMEGGERDDLLPSV